jgi:hypothetical protein
MIHSASVFLFVFDILERIILTFLFFSSPADLDLNVVSKEDETRIFVNIVSFNLIRHENFFTNTSENLYQNFNLNEI